MGGQCYAAVKSPIPIISAAAGWQLTCWTAFPGRCCALGAVRTSLGLSVLIFVVHLCGVEALASAAVSGLKERVFQEIGGPRGKWELMIQLADPSPNLRDGGRYAI